MFKSLHAVFLAEFLNTASGVNNLLFAGIERVALRANFNVQVLAHGRAGLERKATAAVHVDFVVVWVGVWFHESSPCLLRRFGLLCREKLVNYP
jgi:hypothetical protein